MDPIGTRNDPPPELLTVSQVASRLNVHPNTIRRWVRQGLLKAHRIGPRRDRRIHRAEVEQFLGGASA